MSENLYQPDEEVEMPVAEEVTEMEAQEGDAPEEVTESESETEVEEGADA